MRRCFSDPKQVSFQQSFEFSQGYNHLAARLRSFGVYMAHICLIACDVNRIYSY